MKQFKNIKVFALLLIFALMLSLNAPIALANTLQTESDTSPQDVSDVLNEAMATLASTVKKPAFGTSAGEWTVLDLARGGYYAADDPYFQSYYERIVETVNTTATKVTSPKGALHRVKSTDNSRLILALSAIGKNARSVGNWNLIEPFNDFSWVIKQGINGPIFALIALDTHDYQTSDPTIRQQCVDFILGEQLVDGGWALFGNTSDVDITAMALQALVNYKDQAEVSAAAEEAFAFLSSAQLDSGGYGSWGTENVESIVQVVVACGAWGINPDTDSRFVKKGNSTIDGILDFYDPDTKMFCHTKGDGGNAMATDQGIYGLVAYDRYITGQNTLYDMSDVILEDVSDEEIENPFSDLDSSHTHYETIMDLYDREIIKGYLDGTFKAEENLKRQHVAIMLVRSLGLEHEGLISDFEDAKTHSASSYIAAAANAGIIRGYGDGTFKPEKSITRAEVALMVSRAFDIGINTDNLVDFDDVPEELSTYDAIQALASNGVVQGYGDNTFRPLQKVTRGEFTKFLVNSENLIYAQ